MKDLYRTIESPTEGQFKDRGSRFLAFAFRVYNDKDIKKHVAALKKRYHGARHHCYAWRLGADMDHYRVNDDGEPSGSAGKPILGQIHSRELTQILVVAVRYFGGTLLGVGGLINAYRSAAAAALDKAVILEKKVEEQLVINYGYESMNGVMKVVKDFNLDIDNQQFDLDCSITVRVWIRLIPRVRKRLSKIEGCKVSPE